MYLSKVVYVLNIQNILVAWYLYANNDTENYAFYIEVKTVFNSKKK